MKNIIRALFAVQLIGGMLTPAMADSIIVPVPHELQQYGSIKLIGEAGVEQSNTYDIQRCNPESDGSFDNQACRAFKKAKLNEEISVTTGFYRIRYSNMISYIFEVRATLPSYLLLKKLQVPKINGQYRFNVFRDLTDPVEQEKLLQDTWVSDENRDDNYIESNLYRCYDLPSKEYQKVWKSLKLFIGFTNSGQVYCSQLSPARVWVTDPKDGDFVSVLPGTYGIHFINEDGITKDIYGIRVP